MGGFDRSSPKCPLKSSSKKTPTNTLKHLLYIDSKNKQISTQSCSDSETEDLLCLISYCSFTDPQESPSQQDLKRLKLIQLRSIIKTLKNPLDHLVLSPLHNMLSANLFRPLPLPNNICCVVSTIVPDDDLVSNSTPAWPHLQIIYDILLRLVMITNVEQLRTYMDHSFLLSLLNLFQSEDQRERESLKNVYHQIYSKFTFYRPFLRKAMNDVFLHYVYEMDERHAGIGELLEIMGTIINGFSVPLKKDHKLFLRRVLVPLHKPKGMQVYHRQLAYCVSQFVQKEAELGVFVIRGILKYWPVTNSQKEVLFLWELEQLVETLDPQLHKELALPLCTQISKCSNSRNSQVAERALYMWNNEQFWKMASQAMEEVFPVLVEGMEINLKQHWSKSVRQLTENVKEMLQGLQPFLYSKCLLQLQVQDAKVRIEDMRRKRVWEEMENAAKQLTPYSKRTFTK